MQWSSNNTRGPPQSAPDSYYSTEMHQSTSAYSSSTNRYFIKCLLILILFIISYYCKFHTFNLRRKLIDITSVNMCLNSLLLNSVCVVNEGFFCDLRIIKKFVKKKKNMEISFCTNNYFVVT